jgi:hypothetical protein
MAWESERPLSTWPRTSVTTLASSGFSVWVVRIDKERRRVRPALMRVANCRLKRAMSFNGMRPLRPGIRISFFMVRAFLASTLIGV